MLFQAKSQPRKKTLGCFGKGCRDIDGIYQENFPQRAENEKISELSQELKAQQENSVVAQGALLDLISQLHAQGVLTDEI